MSFHGKWFECAACSEIVDGELVQDTPPTTEELNVWIEELKNDPELREDVLHRFILTARNFKTFRSWAKKQFKFRNATPEHITRVEQILFNR